MKKKFRPATKLDATGDLPSHPVATHTDRDYPASNPIPGAVMVFGLSCLLYARTLAPTVTLVDSGELIVAAAGLGVAHPPGFPLYLLVAHIMTLIPVGSVAVRVNATSALFAALTAAGIVLAVAEALRAAPPFKLRDSVSTAFGAGRKRAAPGAHLLPPTGAWPDGMERYRLLPALLAGLLLACSRTLWSYATIAEVYTLNAFLIVAVLGLMFRWGRQGASDASLYLAALVFGLALGVHHVTVGLLLPALAFFVIQREGVRFFRSTRLGLAALCGLGGLLIYAYLPLAASGSPILNWGDPRNLQRLWWHVSGRQYQVNLSISPELMFDQAGLFVEVMVREFGPWWFPAGLSLTLAGMVYLYKSLRKVFWFLGTIMICDLGYSLNYEIAEDKDAYYLPIFICCAIAAGFGANWLLSAAARARTAGKMPPSAVAALLASVVMVALVSNYPYNNRSRYFIARDYVENILSTIGPGGMLLTRDWQVYSPFLYLREIERQRRDVVAIDVSLLRRSWYFDYLERAYPDLMSSSRGPVSAFLEDLLHWERDPDLFQRDRELNTRINSRFYEMIFALISAHLGTSPVYVTSYDIATMTDGPDAELSKGLNDKYQLVPQGLVFQLFSDRAFHDPVIPVLQLRGLADGSLRFEPDDVFRIKVWPVYLNMFTNQGRYLAAHGEYAKAIDAAGRALALEPDFQPARELIGQCAAALKNPSAARPR